MVVETAADRLSFLGLEGHAVSVSYTPSGGSATPIEAIFDSATVQADMGESSVSLPANQLIATRDQVANPATGDTFLIDGVTYNFSDRSQDETGEFWTIFLDEQ